MANMNGEPLDPNLKPEDLLSASIDSDGEPDESVFFQHWFQQIGVPFQDPKTYVRFPVHPSFVMRLSDRSYPFIVCQTEPNLEKIARLLVTFYRLDKISDLTDYRYNPIDDPTFNQIRKLADAEVRRQMNIANQAQPSK